MNSRLASFLLALFALSSVFQAASLLNIGAKDTGYAVSPYFVAQGLVAIFLVFGIFMGKGRLHISSRSFGRPLLWLTIFSLLAVASSLVLPRVFDGMGIYSPRGGIDDQYHRLTPLQATASQIAQAAYLVLNVACVLYFLQARFEDSARTAHRMVVVVTLLVLFFAVWQAVSLATGVYFPNAILYSAAGRSQGFEQTMDGVRRINSTFPEASFLGTFLISSLAYLSRYLLAGWGARYWVLAGVVGVVALASTSTSAYVGLAILGASYVFWFARNALIYRRVSKYAMVLLPIIVASLSALTYLINTNRLASVVYNAALKNKTQSDSFLHRAEADSYALKILFNTGGLGVGLGSNRPSSFLAYLLSNVGLLGTLAFAMFLMTLFGVVRRGKESARKEGTDAQVVASLGWGLGFCLIGMCVAVPDLSFPSLWLWIVLFAMAARKKAFVATEGSPVLSSATAR